MKTLLTHEQRQHVFTLFHRGYACLQVGKFGAHRDEDALHSAIIYFIACLEWATPDSDPLLWAEVRAVLNEAKQCA